jgi:AraC-like DNA-binding protein
VNSFAKPRSPILRQFVKAFHYHENELPFTLERIMPNAQPHLMVNLAEDEFRIYGAPGTDQVRRHSGCVLAGPHAKSVIIDTRAQCWLAAIEFQHGGASRFLTMPMNEVVNQVVPLDSIWGNGTSLRERLLDAPTPALKFRAMEDVLLEHFKPVFDPAIQRAITQLRAGSPVAQVVARLGISPKTLERRFSTQVGIVPKRFARVHRLQRLLRALRRSGTPDWCVLAVEHGYTDQAHLIHDFRDLADITPSEYRPQSRLRNNHVPIVL